MVAGLVFLPGSISGKVLMERPFVLAKASCHMDPGTLQGIERGDKIKDFRKLSLGLGEDCVTRDSEVERISDIMVANSRGLTGAGAETRGGSLTTSCTTRTMRSGTAAATTEEGAATSSKGRRATSRRTFAALQNQNSPNDPENSYY